MLTIKFPFHVREKVSYRCYSQESLDNAYEAVVGEGIPIRTASKMFSVPYSTLHDKVRVNNGKPKLEATRSGPDPLMSQEEEQTLVTHIELMTSFGYGYIRSEVTALATDFAVHLRKKKKSDRSLSLQWFYGFMKRWPKLKVQKPRSLKIMKAKATSQETINKYFDELEHILKKYNLNDRPQAIYNIDERGISENHTIATSSQEEPPIATVDKSSTTTVIGCGNAIGMALPPFFIFKGKRMHKELLSGCTTGTGGAVSDSGWSNSDIFRRYLKDHFSKHSIQATSDKPLLVLYEGHQSHVSLSLIQWAREKNIILFVLPAHTLHTLQPMDIGCFGPFEKILNEMRQIHMQGHATSGIDRCSLAEIACKAYTCALTPKNLQASFQKSGIYPVDRCSVTQSSFLPATVATSSTVNCPENISASVITAEKPMADHTTDRKTNSFRKVEALLNENTKQTKKRKVVSAAVRGKAITTDIISKHQEQQIKKPKKSVTKGSPKSSTSGTSQQKRKPRNKPSLVMEDEDSDAEYQTTDLNNFCLLTEQTLDSVPFVACTVEIS